MSEDLRWVNTPGYNDCRVAGKPLHAVSETVGGSLCGLKRAQWSVDLHNTTRCKCCLRALAKTGRGIVDAHGGGALAAAASPLRLATRPKLEGLSRYRPHDPRPLRLLPASRSSLSQGEENRQ